MLERLFDFPAKSDPGGLGAAGGEAVQLRRVSTGHCRVPCPAPLTASHLVQGRDTLPPAGAIADSSVVTSHDCQNDAQ